MDSLGMPPQVRLGARRRRARAYLEAAPSFKNALMRFAFIVKMPYNE